MSINSVGSNAPQVDALIDRVFGQIDANKDGKLSSTEFGSFLTKMLEGMSQNSGSAGNTTMATGDPVDPPTPDPRPTTPQPFKPIASRYVFAGFSPDNHLGEVPQLNAPKYAVYNELARLSNEPGFDKSNFAATAAANLQALFGNPMGSDGQPLFRAIDGETIGYGDEYVHYAPTGYGLRPGQYDATAPGEFFWGFTGNNA